MNKKRAFVSFLVVAMLLSFLHIFPAHATSYVWSKPRPSTDTIYDETIGNSYTDGIASIGIGVHMYRYVEGVSD